MGVWNTNSLMDESFLEKFVDLKLSWAFFAMRTKNVFNQKPLQLTVSTKRHWISLNGFGAQTCEWAASSSFRLVHFMLLAKNAWNAEEHVTSQNLMSGFALRWVLCVVTGGEVLFGQALTRIAYGIGNIKKLCLVLWIQMGIIIIIIIINVSSMHVLHRCTLVRSPEHNIPYCIQAHF